MFTSHAAALKTPLAPVPFRLAGVGSLSTGAHFSLSAPRRCFDHDFGVRFGFSSVRKPADEFGRNDVSNLTFTTRERAAILTAKQCMEEVRRRAAGLAAGPPFTTRRYAHVHCNNFNPLKSTTAEPLLLYTLKPAARTPLRVRIYRRFFAAPSHGTRRSQGRVWARSARTQQSVTCASGAPASRYHHAPKYSQQPNRINYNNSGFMWGVSPTF